MTSPIAELYSPPEAPPAGRFLVRYRRSLYRPLADSYIAALSDPGDLLLDPFCQDAAVLQAAAAAGRRAVAITGNPLLALLTRVEMAPPSATGLAAALHDLATAPKVDSPLAEHLDGLYSTTCARCREPVAATAFVWDREAGSPVLREYTCPHCHHAGREPLPPEELARTASFAPQGFHRRLLAERLRGEADHQRLQQRLLDLYTPRNLYALSTLLLKIELLFAGSPLLAPLRVALLHTLDVASKLNLPTESGWRPVRSLESPRRFREANVWRAFAEAVQAMAGWPRPPQITPAATLEQALEQPGRPFVGLDSLARLAPRLRGQAALILSRLPRFDPTFAALSYLWSAWLLDREGARAAERLLGQRSPEEARYLRALRLALATLAPTLRPRGHLAIIFQAPATYYLESLLLAAAAAGLRPAHAWHGMLDDRPAARLAVRHVEHHLAFAVGSAAASEVQRSLASLTAPPGAGAIPAGAGPLAAHTALCVISERAEPLPFTALHGPIWAALAREGLLAGNRSLPELAESRLRLAEAIDQALASDTRLRLLPPASGDDREATSWWLADPRGDTPLADRLERYVYQALLRGGDTSEVDLQRGALEEFTGPLAPSWPLLLACRQSYGQQTQPGRWLLAAGEQPDEAGERCRRLLGSLTEIGQRLGYELGASQEPAADGLGQLWLENGLPAYSFLLRDAADSADLRAMPSLATGRRVLVIPERRVALWQHKLNAVPAWAGELERAGWAFLRESALDGLLQEMPDRARFATALGLTPASNPSRPTLDV